MWLNPTQDGCIGWTSPSSDENDEYAHSDEWYQSVYTSWLNDWYYGGDYNKSKPGSFFGSCDIDIGYSDKDAAWRFCTRPFAFEVPEVNSLVLVFLGVKKFLYQIMMVFV